MKLVPKYLNRNTPSFSNKEFQERIIKPPSFTPPDVIPKEMATHINSIDKDVIQMAKAAKGSIDRLYIHWTAGHYDSTFGDYHINITGAGDIYLSTDELTEVLAHG